VTVPLPEPEAPLVIEIHEALSPADQVHPDGALTPIVLVEGSGPRDASVGEIVKLHGAPL
jgi:hypothetical protein